MKKLFALLGILSLVLAGEPRIYSGLTLDEALQAARTSHKTVLVKFHADWCHFCRAMDQNTFSDAAVTEALQDYIVVKVNVDTPNGRVWAGSYDVAGLPTVMVLDANGNVLYRHAGYQGPRKLLASLASARE
ncbi:MAG: thioredoxin family protein [Candidatus Neomarinimicrobiota bacterium]|nr:MAG: thioredoxin family protein [Candidatus Neomarinimicrobiota bacterium]